MLAAAEQTAVEPSASDEFGALALSRGARAPASCGQVGAKHSMQRMRRCRAMGDERDEVQARAAARAA